MKTLLARGQFRTIVCDRQQAFDFGSNQVKNGLFMQLWQGNQGSDISGDALHFEKIIKIRAQRGQLAHDAAFVISEYFLLFDGFADAGVLVIQGQIVRIAVQVAGSETGHVIVIPGGGRFCRKIGQFLCRVITKCL